MEIYSYILMHTYILDTTLLCIYIYIHTHYAHIYMRVCGHSCLSMSAMKEMLCLYAGVQCTSKHISYIVPKQDRNISRFRCRFMSFISVHMFVASLASENTRPQRGAKPSGKHHSSIVPNAKSETRQHLNQRGPKNHMSCLAE